MGQTYRETKLVNTVAGNTNSQEGIAEDPERNQPRTETLVRIIQGLLLLLDGGDVRSQGALHGGLELTVDIRLRLIDFFYYRVFTFLCCRLG